MHAPTTVQVSGCSLNTNRPINVATRDVKVTAPIREIIMLMESNLEEPLDLDQLADCGLAFEFSGKRTTLLGHQTPLSGEHSRLNGCPVSLDHYTWPARIRQSEPCPAFDSLEFCNYQIPFRLLATAGLSHFISVDANRFVVTCD